MESQMNLYNKYRENEDEPKVLGVIYTLPSNALSKILDEKKNIFVKYTPFQPSKKSKIKLFEGMKLYLYETKANKEILGEAIVDKIIFCNLQEIVKDYMNKLMLTKNELEEYCRNRYEKKAMLFILKNIKKYIKPIGIEKNITMGGLYVTSDNIDSLNLGTTTDKKIKSRLMKK